MVKGGTRLVVEMLAEAAGDLVHEFDGGRLDGAEALEHLLAQVGAEQREDLGGLGRLEVRQDERNGLRLLVLDEVVDLAALHFADVLDDLDRRADHGADAADDGRGLVATLGNLERPLRKTDAAGGGLHAAGHDPGELVDRLLLHGLGNHGECGHFAAKRLDLGVVELLQHLGGRFSADANQENRELLVAVELGVVDVGHLKGQLRVEG